MAWTDDTDALLTRLWIEEKTGGEIAEIMRISRNAVLGRARRLKLERRDTPISVADRDAKFDRMMDILAEEEISIYTAARRAGLNGATGYRLFEKRCRDGGEQYA